MITIENIERLEGSVRSKNLGVSKFNFLAYIFNFKTYALHIHKPAYSLHIRVIELLSSEIRIWINNISIAVHRLTETSQT